MTHIAAVTEGRSRIRAHKSWHDDPADGTAAAAYADALTGFEGHAGTIEGAYWCTSVASAVAVTVRRRRRRFFRATAWASQPEQEVAQLLNECDELSVRVAEVLRGTAQRIAMGLVLRTAGNLLALVDAPARHPDDAIGKAVEAERRNLAGALSYYRRAARRQAQIVYVLGMLGGVVLLMAIVMAVLLIVHATANVAWLPHRAPAVGSLSTLYLCAIAGAIGAVVSVMMRIDENAFSVEFEIGRGTLGILGALRPLVGAVFGVTLYAALVSGLFNLFTVPSNDVTKQLLFFLVVAFLAGFSERWTKGVLGGIEKAPAPKEQSPPASGAP